MKLLSAFILVFISAITGTLANAATTISVRSVVNAQDPYEIVVPDEKGPSDVLPGIYALIPGKKDAILVVPGVVQGAGKTFNGILGQFPMGVTTKRYEMMAVIDGRITIFSHQTVAAQKDSRLIIGQNTHAYDAITGTKVAIDPILEAPHSAVNVFMGGSASQGDLFFISIKQPNLHGSGITMAGILKRGTSKMELLSPLTILDYTFMSSNELMNLQVPLTPSDSFAVQSRLHLQAISVPKEDDDRILRRYREFIKQKAGEMHGSEKSVSKQKQAKESSGRKGSDVLMPMAVPYYSLLKRKLILDSLPGDMIMSKPVRIFQQADPINGQSRIFFDVPDIHNLPDTPNLLGSVDHDHANGRYDIKLLNHDEKKTKSTGVEAYFSGRPLLLMKVNERPHFVFFSPLSGKNLAIDLMDSGLGMQVFDGDSMSGMHAYLSQKPASGNGSVESVTHYILFSSTSKGKKGDTYFFRVDENKAAMKVARPLRVMDYEDAERLSKRFRAVSEPNLGPGITALFDNTTKKFIETTDQERMNKLTREYSEVPFLNLSQMEAGATRVYISAQKVTSMLGSTDLRHYQYQEIPGIYFKPASGLYVVSLPGAVRQLPQSIPEHRFVEGSLLYEADFMSPAERKKLGTQKGKHIELRQSIPISSSATKEVGISFIPLITEHQRLNSLKQFDLAIASHNISTDYSGDPLDSSISRVTVPFPHTEFLSARFVVGRRNHRQTMHLLVFIGRPNPTTGLTGTQGVLIYPNIRGLLDVRQVRQADGSFSEDRAFKMNFEQTKPEWLYRGEVTEALIKSRIVFDTEGRPLWIDTPDLERTDIKFATRALTDISRKLLINQGTSGVNIRYDEQLDDTTDFSLGGGSKWILMERKDVQNRVPELSKHLEDLAKAEEAAKKEGARQRRRAEVIFPDLDKYLDELANPKKRLAKHRVMLVSKDLYQTVRNLIMTRFLMKKDAEGAGPFNISNYDFSLYLFDPGFTPSEMQLELQKIGRKPDGRSELLFVDMEGLVNLEVAAPPESRALIQEQTAIFESEDLSADEEAQRLAQEAAEVAEAAEADESEEGESDGAEESEADAHDLSAKVRPSSKSEAVAHRSKKDKTDAELAAEEAEKLKFSFTRLLHIANEGSPIGKKGVTVPGPVKRIPTLILATPQQWREMQVSYPQERKAGVFDSFELDSRFLTSSWTVWPPKSSRVTKEITEYSRAAVSVDEYRVFESLESLMSKLSDPKTPAKHQLLVVPEEIKPLVTRLMMTRWATDHRELGHGWNFRNKDLALFRMDLGSAKQESIYDNYASMKGNLISRRPVMLADMNDVLKAARPGAEVALQTYRLRDPIVATGAKESILGSVNEAGALAENAESETERTQIPHMIWWIASEGKRIQPKRTKGWTLRSEVEPQVPTVIVTTEKEIQALEQDAAFESRFIDIRKSFEVVNLEKPSEERKAALLEELFKRPDLQALQYRFKHDNLSSDEARRQLIGLMVGRVESIARQLKIESTYAFLKIYTAVKKALTEDVELRKLREIDASYIARLFAKVFPLPLSWEILRPEDNLQRFRDPDQAARGLQEAGYEGATELKTRAVRAVTAHTRGGADRGRRIPSSVVLIGDTSSGKTFLIETMIKYLGLKMYNYNKPFDEEVGAMIIRVMDLVDKEDPSHPEKMSVDKVLEHLDNFVSMPNGWRGLVLFDDLHKAASKEILAKLMTRIQSMHEAEGGVIRVRRMSHEPGKPGEIMERPVRNIQMVITLNPTKDLKKRERYIEKWGRKDPVLEAVAALNRDGYEVEESVLARFGEVIDMSEFPREAKVPSLLKTLQEGNQAEFSAYPRLILVTPETLDLLVNAFPTANARDFLTPATYALMNLSSEMSKAPIYLIEPQSVAAKPKDAPAGTPQWDEGIGADGLRKVEPAKIDQALRQKTAVYQITPQDHFSKIQLISFMANNFRAQVLNSVVLAAQADPSISGDHDSRVTQLASLLMSIMGHLGQAPKVPLGLFDIRPQHLGIKDLDTIREFQKRVRDHSSNQYMPLVNVPSQSRNGEVISLNSFLGQTDENVERVRMDVLIEASRDIQSILESALAASVRVKNLADLKDPSDWAISMNEVDPKLQFKEAAQSLLRLYSRFSRDLYQLELQEMRTQQYETMQFYDQYRLFWLSVDAALMRLPWGFVSNFVLNGVDAAVKDLALGQRAGFQHFLFKSQLSPLSTVTPESVLLNIRGMGPLRDISPEQLQRFDVNFKTHCQSFLEISSGEAKR